MSYISKFVTLRNYVAAGNPKFSDFAIKEKKN
jgi:hypothetical protein